MAGTELRPRTGEASTRQRLLIPAFVHLRPSPTRFLQPSFTRPGAESLDGPGLLDCPGLLDSPGGQAALAPVPDPPVGERSPTGNGVRRAIHPDDEPTTGCSSAGPLRLSWVGPTVASWL
jgi:hypothetical protein